jgi:pimeloyl-ACP methyl ester carboxylesterase
MMRALRFVSLVLLLAPAAAGAQAVDGSTPEGLSYEVSGSGEPVVLIHAFSVERRMWAPQIAALEGRYRVIRYDLRGHGRSAAPAAAYAPHDDLRSVLDALGVARAALVGLSAGSTLAIDFAIAYPDRVTRLVLASPGLNGHVPSPPLTWTAPVFQAAGAGDAEKAARLWAETPIMALRNDLSAAATVRTLVMDNVKLWTFRTNPARPLTPPAIGRLAEVSRPTLVILGGEDLPHIAEIAGLLTKGIAGARLTTIPGADHMTNLDAPDAFNRAMDGFLAGP